MAAWLLLICSWNVGATETENLNICILPTPGELAIDGKTLLSPATVEHAIGATLSVGVLDAAYRKDSKTLDAGCQSRTSPDCSVAANFRPSAEQASCSMCLTWNSLWFRSSLPVRPSKAHTLPLSP